MLLQMLTHIPLINIILYMNLNMYNKNNNNTSSWDLTQGSANHISRLSFKDFCCHYQPHARKCEIYHIRVRILQDKVQTISVVLSDYSNKLFYLTQLNYDLVVHRASLTFRNKWREHTKDSEFETEKQNLFRFSLHSPFSY